MSNKSLTKAAERFWASIEPNTAPADCALAKDVIDAFVEYLSVHRYD